MSPVRFLKGLNMNFHQGCPEEATQGEHFHQPNQSAKVYAIEE